ncbi:MAG: hypothetical protein VR64_02410 [Desulfatitalea sp. BRH_c12]|nr:MAG: hypothetical protein VR64_02410 [Desulfatitalea sp. BRH_c12]
MKKAYAIVASIILIYFGFISATFAAALGALDISDLIYDDAAQVFSFDMYQEYSTHDGYKWHQDAVMKAPDKYGVQAPIVSAGLELNSFRNYGPFANYQTAANPLQDLQYNVSNEAELTASSLSESAVTLLIGAVMIGLSGLLRKKIQRQEAKRSQSTVPSFTPVFSGTKKLY